MPTAGYEEQQRAGGAVRVLLLDHQEPALEAVIDLLDDVPRGFVVEVARFADIVEARPSSNTVVLCDPHVAPGQPTLREIVDAVDGPVGALTACQELGCLLGALRVGARGYLSEAIEPDAFAVQLERLAAGEHVLDPHMTGVLAAYVAAGSATRWGRAATQLTRREGDVAALLAQGLANRQIANRLFVGVETIKTHVRAISRKLGANDRAEAVEKARHHLSEGPHGPPES